MRRLILALLFWLCLAIPASADGPPLYFPVISRATCAVGVDEMSDFKVIVPSPSSSAITNKALNPSAETTGNFAALAGTTITRVTTTHHYGLYGWQVQSNANNEGGTWDLETLSNAAYWVTIRVSGTPPATWLWSLDNVTYTAPALLEAIDNDWNLYGLLFPALQANGSGSVWLRQSGAGTYDFYLDGLVVTEDTDETYSTYIDGTQPGCEWNGAPHASTSTLSPNSRAGGIVYDLEDDYGFEISGMSGTGTAPQELFIDSYSQLPGGEPNAIKTNSRVITLAGLIRGSTQAEFHTKKQALKSILAKDAVPQDQNGYQPVRLRYTGATVHKEIAVYYEGGLETNITADDPCGWEKVAIRFIAPNPYWYEIGESAALLDTNDSATFGIAAGRLRSTGQWSTLGSPAGTLQDIRAIVEDATYVYFAGIFVNYDGNASADYIVRYNKATGAYTALDAGLSTNAFAMAIAPNGDLYVGGSFVNASGVAAADYLAVWAVGASAFAAVGTPLTGAAAITSVRALAFDRTGNLYIGGDFDNWGNIANADNIVMWDSSTYSALSTGVDDTVFAIAVALDNTIYIGGQFSNPYNDILTWDGSVFSQIDTGQNTTVRGIAITPSGLVYAAFGPSIQAWNDTGWIVVGTANSGVLALAFSSGDGILYAGGVFDSIDGVSTGNGLARFNDYAWARLDLKLAGAANIHAVLPSKYVDPVVPQKYNLWVGFDSFGTGTGNFAGLETVSNGGTVPAFPKIIFSRSGGTTATIQTLRNERNGQEILFNYALLNGETLTIDLGSTRKSINSSFFGPRQGAKLPNSDFGAWHLLSGNNEITSFVSTTGSPTITAWMIWKDFYDSQD